MRAEFSKRTKLEAFQAQGGKCKCGARLFPGNLEYHHEKACAYEGGAELGNCVALCRACHRRITNWQAKQIAKDNRVRANHLNLTGRARGFAGWRKFNGEIKWRDR